MPLAATATLLASAGTDRRAVAAFDVVTLEHVHAVVAGAEAAGAPVIVQISESAVQYHDGRLLPLARAAAETARSASVPVALHLDRVRRTALLAQAAHCGFSSIMYDAAHLPYHRRVAVTRDAVAWAHQQGLWTEAEPGPEPRTDPDAARAFAAATGVDALAVAVRGPGGSGSRSGTSGTSVGGRARKTARFDPQLLARLRSVLPVPLVLRGLADLSDDELARAAGAGAAKVVAGSALDLAMTEAVRARLTADVTAGPREWLHDGRRAMSGVVTRFIDVLAAARVTTVSGG